jgi:hypothetical protein
MRGFKFGVAMLRALTLNHLVVAVQEHWLDNDNMYKLRLANDDYLCFDVSGMSDRLASGLVCGRPFGGVAL